MPFPLFTRYFKSFGQTLADAVPGWRSFRPGKYVGSVFEQALVHPFSIMIDQVFQATNAAAPGDPAATKDAIPYVGQSRGLMQGEAESYDAYAKRLRNWIGPAPFTGEIWANMAKTELLAQAIQTYLANNPTVRVIERTYPDTAFSSVVASGTSPPEIQVSGFMRPDGSPIDQYSKVKLWIEVAGPVGTALFAWAIDGQGDTVGGHILVSLPIDQTELVTADAVMLGDTGIRVGFPPGPYSTDNVWTWSTALPAPLEATWITANTDGTTSKTTAAWDWDSKSGHVDGFGNHWGLQVEQWWSDLWIVVFPCEWAITGATLAALDPLWGDSQGVGLGHAAPRKACDDILALVAQYKGNHTFVRAIIWSYDGTKFLPSNPTADGFYGNPGKLDGSGNMVPARDPSARYCLPANG